MATYTFQIVTPEQEIFNAPVQSAVLPGSEGSFGVMANHAPLVAALAPGTVQITDEDNRELRLFVGGGFFQVSNNTAMLLADSAEFASDINVDRAREAESRATGRLAGQLETENMQRERASESLQRARARLRVASK